MFLLVSRLSGQLRAGYKPVHAIILGSWRQFLQGLRFKKHIPEALKQRAATLSLDNITKPDAKVSLFPTTTEGMPRTGT